MAKTPDTHLTESLEKTTWGKRYFVIDDAKHVWGADQDYQTAVRTKEVVAGNLWSKTPTIREMPQDQKLCRKIISLVRGPDGAKVEGPPATHGTDADLEKVLAELPVTAETVMPIAAASSNGSGQAGADEGDDDDLSDLLDA